MIGAIGSVGSSPYTYMYNPIQPASASQQINGVAAEDENAKAGTVQQTEKKHECQTCKNRKYVDGSDEMVSFKAPAHIDPGAAGARVRAHEQEHVSNAFSKAAKGNGKVLQASVAIKMAICPECGRAYICGGTTTTKIRYSEDNPYSKNQKSANYDAVRGANVDAAV